MNKLLGVFSSTMCASLAAAVAGVAGDFQKSLAEPAPEERVISRTELFLESTYVGESGFRRGAGKFGEQDAFETRITFTHRIPVSGRWHMKFGADYHRFDFGRSLAPVDTTLQGAAAIIALEYVVAGEVGFFIESAPGFYFSDTIDSESFNAPTNVAFAYSLSRDSLYLIAGVSYSGLREYPVLPLGGLLWKINPEWTLKAYLPQPRLIYHPHERFAIWIGGELAGGSFRTSDRNVEPDRISGALVDYSEYRAGAGVTWTVQPGFVIDAGAGYVFAREFDYHRAGEAYGLENAPFATLSGRLQF